MKPNESDVAAVQSSVTRLHQLQKTVNLDNPKWEGLNGNPMKFNHYLSIYTNISNVKGGLKIALKDTETNQNHTKTVIYYLQNMGLQTN
jgi:hypothetical protein